MAGAVVADEHRLLGPEDLDLVELGEEHRFDIAHQLGEAEHGEGGAGPCGLDVADEPLLVADDDAGAGGVGGLEHSGQSNRSRRPMRSRAWVSTSRSSEKPITESKSSVPSSVWTK